MKKSLLAIAAAVSVASLASAATVNWMSGVLYTPASADGGITTTKAKNTVTATYFIINADDYAALATADLATKVAKANTLTADANVTSASTTSKANWVWTEAAAGTTYYALAVYSTTYGSTPLYIAEVVSASVGSGGAAVSTSDITSGKSWAPLSTTPVPEPTTVALLALGLAAVGLKRKVA